MKPLLRIEHVDKIEVINNYSNDQSEEHPEKVNSATKTETKKKLYNKVDVIAKIVSIVSGLALIVFVILLFYGKTTIGSVQTSTLLTVISVTLIGGIVSIGGVQMFSFNASLRKVERKIQLKEKDECPFDKIMKNTNSNWEGYAPGNPRFCSKCPLFVDEQANVFDPEMQICGVFPKYYERWLSKQ